MWIGQPKLPSRKERRRKMRERLPNHEQETRLAEEKLTLEIKTHSDLYFQALDGNDPSISKLHTLPKGIKKLLDYNS